LTPFSVLGLLDRLQKTAPLAEPQRAELAQVIAKLEEQYFAGNTNGNGDLLSTAEYWLRMSKFARS
ncbi:MAG TPA: hypothetical protein VHV77_07455, partial [Pirellulales bacterium]|nr:hypothetical protein [Pirellulales bacterium]